MIALKREMFVQSRVSFRFVEVCVHITACALWGGGGGGGKGRERGGEEEKGVGGETRKGK